MQPRGDCSGASIETVAHDSPPTDGIRKQPTPAAPARSTIARGYNGAAGTAPVRTSLDLEMTGVGQEWKVRAPQFADVTADRRHVEMADIDRGRLHCGRLHQRLTRPAHTEPTSIEGRRHDHLRLDQAHSH